MTPEKRAKRRAEYRNYPEYGLGLAAAQRHYRGEPSKRKKDKRLGYLPVEQNQNPYSRGTLQWEAWQWGWHAFADGERMH